jgi:tRNA uridine 5-carboxymethylaminomethyl modification enzyme
MGVMIDDLVTRGTREPYRMFTSRAEYRLILREDNADLRLMETGHELGLIDDDVVKDVQERKKQIAEEIKRIKKTIVKPSENVNNYLIDQGVRPLKNGIYLDQLLKRTGLNFRTVETVAKPPNNLNHKVTQQVEIEIKYEGYIQRQLKEIRKFKNLEKKKIPIGLDFLKIHGLSNELKEKLSDVGPASLGQTTRIDGITPAAISAILIALKCAGNPSNVKN